MGLLGYQNWKAELVESGICRQTIRARRRYPVKVGDRLFHYRGLRTAKAKRLRQTVQDFCQQTFPIELHAGKEVPLWIVDNEVCGSDDPALLDISTRDGFKSVEEMTAWFLKNHKQRAKGDLLFVGDVIRW